MRHDVISKTLPPTDLALRMRSVAVEVNASMRAENAKAQDSAMIERDLSRGAKPPAPAAEDPLGEFRECLDELIEFVGEDSINSCRSTPGGHGCIGPDISGMDSHVDTVLRAVRKLMRQPEPEPAQAPAVDTGLLTIHNPDRRLR